MSILYAATGGGGGDDIIPDLDIISSPTEANLVKEVKATNNVDQHVVSGWGIKTWANQCLEKRIIIKNTSGGTQNIGSVGIGEWQDDPSGATETDEIGWGWYHDDALELDDKINAGSTEGEWYCSEDDIEVNFLFDPSTTSVPIALGGYILDTSTGYLCIKFAAELANRDLENLKIAVDVKVTRTNVGT